jgi:hypothetical protein
MVGHYSLQEYQRHSHVQREDVTICSEHGKQCMPDGFKFQA